MRALGELLHAVLVGDDDGTEEMVPAPLSEGSRRQGASEQCELIVVKEVDDEVVDFGDPSCCHDVGCFGASRTDCCLAFIIFSFCTDALNSSAIKPCPGCASTRREHALQAC